MEVLFLLTSLYIIIAALVFPQFHCHLWDGHQSNLLLLTCMGSGCTQSQPGKAICLNWHLQWCSQGNWNIVQREAQTASTWVQKWPGTRWAKRQFSCGCYGNIPAGWHHECLYCCRRTQRVHGMRYKTQLALPFRFSPLKTSCKKHTKNKNEKRHILVIQPHFRASFTAALSRPHAVLLNQINFVHICVMAPGRNWSHDMELDCRMELNSTQWNQLTFNKGPPWFCLGFC